VLPKLRHHFLNLNTSIKFPAHSCPGDQISIRKRCHWITPPICLQKHNDQQGQRMDNAATGVLPIFDIVTFACTGAGIPRRGRTDIGNPLAISSVLERDSRSSIRYHADNKDSMLPAAQS